MKSLPASLAERLKTNRFRRPNRYVQRDENRILAETYCKRCGCTLSSIAPDPRLPSTRRVVQGTKERTVILETFVSRLPTRDADSIEFELEEPSPEFRPTGGETRDEEPRIVGRYVTAICTTCKRELLDGDKDVTEVQELYEADLERLAIEAAAAGKAPEPVRALLEKLEKRRVSRVLG